MTTNVIGRLTVETIKALNSETLELICEVQEGNFIIDYSYYLKAIKTESNKREVQEMIDLEKFATDSKFEITDIDSYLYKFYSFICIVNLMHPKVNFIPMHRKKIKTVSIQKEKYIESIETQLDFLGKSTLKQEFQNISDSKNKYFETLYTLRERLNQKEKGN